MAKMTISRALALALSVAAIGKAAPAQTTPETPMTFTVKESPTDRRLQALLEDGDQTIYAAGQITPGTTKRFRDFIAAKRITQARVYFDSSGGSVVEGMELGSAIRELHFNTDVGAAVDSGEEAHSMCASACAYSYAGGESRFLNKGSGRLGIHQFSGDRKKAPMSETQIVSGLIVAYLTDMGVDAKAFTLAAMTEPDSILWLSPDDAEQLGFVNNGILPTQAEIKLVKMTPVLVLTQIRYDRKVKVGFGCLGATVLMDVGIDHPRDMPRDLRRLTSAYFEFDGQMALMKRGVGGADIHGREVHLSREIDEETQLRLLKTGTMRAWIETGAPYRWGGPIDLKDVHEKMDEFFRQCTSGETIAASAPSTPGPSGRHELIFVDMRREKDRAAIIFIDRPTIRRTGTMAQVAGYTAGVTAGKPFYVVSAYELDCAGLRVKKRLYSSSREGEALESQQGAWQAAMPATNDNRVLRYACGTEKMTDENTIRTADVFAVLRRFIDNKLYERDFGAK